MFQEVATLFVLVFGLTSDGVVGFGVGAGLTFCGFVVLGSMGLGSSVVIGASVFVCFLRLSCVALFSSLFFMAFTLALNASTSASDMPLALAS